jgi:DNA modification methylase
VANLSFEFREPPETAFTATQRCIAGDARELSFVDDSSVHLIVTSPPYPMIEMWDEVFASSSPAIAEALACEDGDRAFLEMHAQLDLAWAEGARVLIPGGLLCIDIGDATRRIGSRFSLYPNHARIIHACLGLGLHALPMILWRKPTNAPNKFMGSGMLPAGAYVTLEHEYILVFRKGGKREFSKNGQERRRASAYFWEERNQWFSDTWSFTGVRQAFTTDSQAKELRSRTAAFPFELPWRLIHMYSLQEDTVLDPFAGTGTTMLAAASAGRNGIGVELEQRLCEQVAKGVERSIDAMQHTARSRLSTHEAFVRERLAQGKPPKHHNETLAVPVVTRQERELRIPVASAVERRESAEGLHQVISYSYLTRNDE